MSHRERIIRDGLTNANISYEEFSKLDDHKLSVKKSMKKQIQL
jgi:hypothetical protein